MTIQKILRNSEWITWQETGRFAGSADDLRDGFIHLSSPAQVAGTLARHFSGQAGLWLVTLDDAALGDELRWEASRDGALFPHLYRAIDLGEVVEATEIAADR